MVPPAPRVPPQQQNNRSITAKTHAKTATKTGLARTSAARKAAAAAHEAPVTARADAAKLDVELAIAGFSSKQSRTKALLTSSMNRMTPAERIAHVAACYAAMPHPTKQCEQNECAFWSNA